jgi:hypothetical protein
MKAYKKWDAINHKINIRRHQAAIKRVAKALAAASNNNSNSNASCATERVFSSGGALIKIT